MNCANHAERTATAFCQNCGKPLCPECTRTADGLLLCEPCFSARRGTAAPNTFSGQGAGAGWQPVATGSSGTSYAAAPAHASPAAAAWLAILPGVGAMYNGQFVKALLHVIIFIILIGITDHLPLVGILIAAWFFYQIFDAAQTAAARRDGRPLPDPFGILDLSQRLGPHPAAAPIYAPAQPGVPREEMPAGTAAYASAPFPPAALVPQHGEPTGAIVLIVVGLLLLLSTLGILNIDWIDRGWPVLLVIAGVWLLIRRVRASQPAQLHSPAPTRSASLSITPQYTEPEGKEKP